MVQSHHQGSDRYSEAFPELGLAYLAEVEWTTPKPARVHTHPEDQFLWVLNGRMVVETLGKHFDESTGALFVLPAGQPHLVQAAPGQTHLHFIDLRLRTNPGVTLGTLGQFLINLGEPRLFLTEKTAQQLAANLRAALASSVSAVPFKAARVQAILWEALSTVRKYARTSKSSGVQAGGVHWRAAENAMLRNLAEQVQVAALAKEAGLSRSQLTRIFLRQSGVGPAERLRQLRIEKACELLRSSTRSVKEIAHECGFVCPNHFCRVFRIVMHATPTKYRMEYEGG